MRVGILGARGIPACYSGYDTLVEELALGLVEQHDTEVVVYCRSNYYQDRPSVWNGIRLVHIPVPRGIKGVESLFHSFVSALHVLTEDVDVVYFLDPANAPFCAMLRCFGKKVVIHTDGLGWKRRKWGPLARRYYKSVEWACAKVGSALVTDNPAMQDYYKEEYGAETLFISYGATNRHGVNNDICAELGLERNQYLLVVARLEPENNTDMVIAEYKRSGVKMPLVVVGDAPYGPEYMKHLKELGNERVLFAGRINDQAKLNGLYRGAYLYIHGHEVGGTNPSLLRAMDAGVAPVVVNIPFNSTVIEDSGVVFDKDEGALASVLQHLVANPAEVRRLGQSAKARSLKHFSWDAVAADHHDLFARLSQERDVMTPAPEAELAASDVERLTAVE